MPTDAQRAEVRTLAGLGTNREGISRRIGVSLPVLDREFKAEMARGVDEANLQVAQATFNMATGRRIVRDADGRERTERCDPNPTMAIYWTKTRMGWKEPPIEHEHDVYVRDKSTEEIERDLEALRARRRAAAGNGTVPPGANGQPPGVLH